jgi:hypothetical protein
MEINVRTVWAQHLLNAMFHHVPYRAITGTTLNEKLGILTGQVAPDYTYPINKFFAIGNKGHDTKPGQAGIPLPVLLQHRPKDAALFGQIPFVLRSIDDDLLPSQRARYALRKEITVASKPYIAYYLRRIPMELVTTKLKYRNVNNGVVTESDFIPDASCLDPVPVIPNTTGVNTTSGDYILAISSLSIEMNTADTTELINACTLLFGSPEYAIISEVALCHGIDQPVIVNAASGQYTFLDAHTVQVSNYLSDFRPCFLYQNGFTRTVDVGSNNPMLNLT